MKPVAIISDIHANLEAFETVLKDIALKGVTDIYCLGDVIGYGPNPRECLSLTHKFANFTLRGNHEDALLFLAADFNPEAATVIDWTRTQINDRRYAKEQNHAIWNYLGDLEEKRQIGDVLYLHASPRRPTKEYVRPQDAQDHEKTSSISSRESASAGTPTSRGSSPRTTASSRRAPSTTSSSCRPTRSSSSTSARSDSLATGIPAPAMPPSTGRSSSSTGWSTTSARR